MTDALSHNLNRLMSEERLSSSELGRRIKIPSTTIKGIRNGDSLNPTFQTLTKLAEYFKISISELTGDVIYNQEKSDCFKIPIINWHEANSWSSAHLSEHYELCTIDKELSKESFALCIDEDEYLGKFNKGGFIFVDPIVKYLRDDYVLVQKTNQKLPFIRKLLLEEGSLYLQQINNEPNMITPSLTNEYKILGVIMGYKKWFKV